MTHEKNIKLAYNDSSTSTCFTTDDNLSKEESRKTHAVATKMESLSSTSKHNDLLLVSPTVPEQDGVSSYLDSSKSDSLLFKKNSHTCM